MDMINSGADMNALNEEGEAVIHNIIKKKRKDKLEMLLTLLINSEVDVNLQNWKGNTALHIAIEVRKHAVYRWRDSFACSVG